MLSTDISLLKSIIENHYLMMIKAEFGEVGDRHIIVVMETIKDVYRYIEPGICSRQIIVLKSIDDSYRPSLQTQSYLINNLQHLPRSTKGSLIIQILDAGNFLVWNETYVEPQTISSHAVVYEFMDAKEKFYAKDQSRDVINNDPLNVSTFAIPTFTELQAALYDYRDKMVRHSTCRILQQIWYDSNRLFLKSGPEHIIRNSLEQFLRVRLRGDVEVRAEQNVDESHPVDIKITWMLCNRLAIVEIKWLGKSKDETGKISKTWTQSRAIDGAKQLVSYLDSNLQRAPQHITRGYLVVLDARRHKLSEKTTQATQKDGFHFAHLEINYNPIFNDSRVDFAAPLRLFAEPICTIPTTS